VKSGFPKLKLKLVLIVISALLMSLAFHPLGLHFLAWFGLVPLLFAIDNVKPRSAFVSGITFGFIFALFSLFWLIFLQIEANIKVLMMFGLILMFLYIGLYFGVSLLIANRIGIWFLPLVISGLEFLKGLGELGFPWLTLGYTQARYPLIIQQASLYGVYGLSLWLVLFNVSLYKFIKIRQMKYLTISLFIFVLPLLYGVLRIKKPDGEYVTIGIVQPNIDPNLKFTRAMRDESFNRLIRSSEECAHVSRQETDDSISLIVWPETAIPLFLTMSDEHQRLVTELTNRINSPLFTGTPLYDRTTRGVYNGAVLIEPEQGITQEYRKMHLVPFGEHIPFDRYIPLFRKIDFGEGDYLPGNNFTVFKTNRLTFSCLICFESIFTDLSREFVNRGAQLLVNITNDGWFGKISGPQQHNDMAILRTVENGVPLVRSANTGISMVVDQYGRILEETPLFQEDYIVRSISVTPVRTIYRSIGDVVSILSLIICTIFLTIKVFVHMDKKVRFLEKFRNVRLQTLGK
jgi:apolipoprotein N-acyltransferase